MSSFTCPHLDLANDHCNRLGTDCVPGRLGCVLRGKVEFAVPAEERVRAREDEKRQRGLLPTSTFAKALLGLLACAAHWPS